LRSEVPSCRSGLEEVSERRTRRTESSGQRNTREQAGPRYAVLLAISVDVENGHTQIATIPRGNFDNLLQSRINKEITLADIGRSALVRTAAAAPRSGCVAYIPSVGYMFEIGAAGR
jgi:hypothetical protein